MSQSLPIPPGFDSLSIEDQIDYVQSLWDRIAARPDEVPLPDWHKEILRERLLMHQDDSNRAKPWEEVEEAITEELRRHRK